MHALAVWSEKLEKFFFVQKQICSKKEVPFQIEWKMQKFLN